VLIGVEDGWRGEGEPKFDGSIDHGDFLGDNFGAASHAAEVMAGVAVVALDRHGVSLANDMAFGRQHFGKSVPIVAIENAVC